VADEQPFFFGQVVLIDDLCLGERVPLVVVGYERRDDTMTWYLGEPVDGWAATRAALLRDLDGRGRVIDHRFLGPIVRRIVVPIVALGDHRDLFSGAVVCIERELAVVASYLVQGDAVEFVLRAQRATSDPQELRERT
jgi:hypothetical protein